MLNVSENGTSEGLDSVFATNISSSPFAHLAWELNRRREAVWAFLCLTFILVLIFLAVVIGKPWREYTYASGMSLGGVISWDFDDNISSMHEDFDRPMSLRNHHSE
ncbi:unnamed protein product [Darwinula stevensoni]|uniref:Uncharacterized protein n=1 Tax=Darwinula stevensoni TaxID=69355 RepID=A0A7R9A5C3_9CRUS|nr:unnamed protein product [Darwinula stevensoni]CAG0891748.1 unnamed protein product [Darwinula stevensoni]